jgi:CHAD domain-containing protein
MTGSSLDTATPLLRSKIREVFRHLPKAMAGDEDAIHEMRVAGRRLRVALPHLAQKPDGRRVRRALAGVKELTRTAGASRDLDVMLACFEEEGPGDDGSRVLSQLVARLRAARRRGRGRMAEALLDLDIARLRRDLRAITQRGTEAVLSALTRIRQTQADEARELLLILDALGPSYEAEALHRLRIRSRRLRYAAELEAELLDRPSDAIEILKALQDDLGRIRDLYLVAGWFEAQAARAHARGAEDEGAESQRQDHRFRTLSRDHHVRLLAYDPRARIDEAMQRLGHYARLA